MLNEVVNHAAAVQCVVVTVPAAAVLGEVISWAYGRALHLGRLDANRRRALEALVDGASDLHSACTADESTADRRECGGRDVRWAQDNVRVGSS